MTRILTSIAFVFLLLVTRNASADEVSCVHFTKDVQSGSTEFDDKSVGVDTGPVNDNNKIRGYDCKVEFGDNAQLNNYLDNYLYFGEVAESSYIEVTDFDSKKVVVLTRGMTSLADTSPRFTKVIPLFFAVGSLKEVNPNRVRLKLYYRSISNVHNGLRSGAPLFLNLTQLISRIIFDFSSISIHFVQLLFILVSLIFWLTSVGIRSWHSKSVILFHIFAFFALFELTGLLRYYFGLQFSYRLTAVLQTLAWLSMSEVIDCSINGKGFFSVARKQQQIVLLSIGVLTYFVIFPYSSFPFWVVLGSQIFLAAILPVILNFAQLKKNGYMIATDAKKNKLLSRYLIFIAVCFCHDFVNWFFLNSRNKHLNHYLFYSSSLGIIHYLRIREVSSKEAIHKSLSALNLKYLSILSDTKNFYLELQNYVVEIASVMSFGVKKLSKFSGGLEHTLFGSGETLGTGHFVLNHSISDDHYLSAVLIGKSESCSVPSFYLQMHSEIQSYFKTVLGLFVKSMELNDSVALVKTLRQKVHFLQLKGEEYLIQNFAIDDAVNDYSIALSDVVDSVVLNERYSAEKMQAFYDVVLEEFWNLNKELGFVVWRDKGDAITFIVPSLKSNESHHNLAFRASEIMQRFMEFQEVLVERKRQHKIAMKVQFRTAIALSSESSSIVIESDGTERVSSSNGNIIDATARAMSTAALPNEVLFVSQIGDDAKAFLDLLELPDHRFKGKRDNTKIYLLLGRKQSKASA